MRDVGWYWFWFTSLSFLTTLPLPLFMLLAFFLRIFMACPLLMLPLKVLKPVVRCQHVRKGAPPHSVREIEWRWRGKLVGMVRVVICEKCAIG